MAPRLSIATCLLALAGALSPRPGLSISAARADSPRGAEVATKQEPFEHQYVLGAAHLPGLNQTVWRTSLEVCNLGAAARTVEIAFLARGQANLAPPAVTMLLPWGRCARFDDVVGSLFGLQEAAGALRVGCDGDGCMAVARTFNDTLEGTYGSGQPALAVDSAVSVQDTAALIHLAESADDGSGSRTNLELLSASAVPLTLHVDLYRANGVELGSLAVELLPFESRQLTRVFRQVTAAAIADGYALLHTSTADGRFFAAASLVDNRTGDGTTIPAAVTTSPVSTLEPITVDNGRSVRLLAALRIPGFLPAPTSQCSVDFSPDGSLLAGACGRSTVPVWEVATGHLARSLLSSPSHVVGVAFGPDGGTLATAEFSGRIAFWDASTGSPTGELRLSPSPVWELAFSPDGGRLGVASVNYSSSLDPECLAGMRVVELPDGTALWAYPADGSVIPLAVGFAPDGGEVAFGTLDDGLVVMGAAGGQPIWTFPVAAPVADVAYSPDGLLLAAAADDTRIRLFRASDHRLARELEGHTHFVNGIAFNPDGSLLASGSHDRTVGLWDVETGQRLAVLSGHDSAVLRVAVNPAGTLVASISWDGTVRLWGVTRR